MDLLGKKAEEASEEVEAVVEAVEDLNSHLNALDNAVQQHDKELDQIVENLRREEEFLKNIEENRSKMEKLREIFRKFASVQTGYIKNVDILDSEVSEAKKNISRLETQINQVKSNQDAIFNQLESLEERIDEAENEFILDTNRQEWDIESKVDSSDFEDREKEVNQQISKLRTSINSIAEKLDDEEIEVE